MNKDDVETVERAETVDSINSEKLHPLSYVAEPVDSHHKSQAERNLVLKADLVILPLAALIYFVAYLDRNSIGNARILGMQKELKLTSNQFYNCLSMFFVGYVVFMLPGNILLRTIRPHRQLGAAVMIFGALLCGMSAAQNYQTVLALRILIGAAQAFVQGLGLYTTIWYKRDEIATRGAIYYSAATISGAFSGLIAYGVLENLTYEATGRDPWRWLFIIEGSMALGVGALTWIFLPQFPDQIKAGKHWLFSRAEVALAVDRSSSYNTQGAGLEVNQIWSTLTDPKSWAFAMINAGVAQGVGSVGVFLPTFVKAFGFSAEKTQLISVIPYACATVSTIVVGITSDRLNKKGVFLIASIASSCIGYVMLLTVKSVTVKVVATCFVTAGLYPAVILVIAWLGSNTAGFTKRGSTWALAEIFGQCFSIMATHVYNDPPTFVQGHSIELAFLVSALCFCIFLMYWMDRENNRKEREEAEYLARGEVHPHASRSLEEELDHHVSFRYIL